MDSQQPINAAHALLAVLKQKHERGETKVWLSPEDRVRLKQLPARLKDYLSAPASSAVQQSTVIKEKPPATQSLAPDPAPAAESPRVREPEPASPVSQLSKPERLAEVKARAEVCVQCRSMNTLRDTMVFAVGNPDADLMFVGEAPGVEEEKLREPFVGPAGQLLDKILKAMGLERSEIYISNIVKFRPRLEDQPDQGTRNRKPTSEEMAAAVQYVKEEIQIVEPKVIVALGGTAMEGLLGIEGSVSRMRSQFHNLDGKPVMVTYHPSYLLRNESISEKRKVWEDMLMVMERLELQISEKQRGFFKKG